jgi:hypothetical protein
VRRGLRGEREGLLEASFAPENLEVLAPGELQVGLLVDEFEVSILRLGVLAGPEVVSRAGQGALTRLGGEDAKLGGREHSANVPAGPRSARGADRGDSSVALAP